MLTRGVLQAFVPSLMIVASVVAVFAGGRAGRWVAERLAKLRRPLAIAVALVSVAFLRLFATNGSSPYALLLPLAFAAGFFVRRRPITRGIFDR